MSLSRRAQQTFDLIVACMTQTGVPPTVDEIRVALGVRSKTTAWKPLLELEEHGYIRRLSKRARAVEILKRPEHDNQLRTIVRASVNPAPIPRGIVMAIKTNISLPTGLSIAPAFSQRVRA